MEHHPAYAEVWERVLPQSRDPYEISERFGEEFADPRRLHRALPLRRTPSTPCTPSWPRTP